MMDEYGEYLKGKKVAFYCPSPHLDKKETGKLIDQCDIVIGTNNAIFRNMNPVSVGSRLDVIYHNFSHYRCENLVFDSKMWREFKAEGGEWIVTARNSTLNNKYIEEYKEIRSLVEDSGLNFRDIRASDFMKVKALCARFPTTGIYGVYDLLQFECEIYVFGMYHPRVTKKVATGYNRPNRVVVRGGSKKHDFVNEAEVLLKLAQLHRDKIKLDPLCGKLDKHHIYYKTTRFQWDRL